MSDRDLADREKPQALADDLIARGNILGIVNNGGLARHETMGAVDPDAFAAVMDLNVRPALQLTQALLPGMRAGRYIDASDCVLVRRNIAEISAAQQNKKARRGVRAF